LGNTHDGQYIVLNVICNSNIIKEVVMTVWLNRNNSANNKDLVYISKLLEKIAPDLKNRNQLIKEGVIEALTKNWATLNVGEKELSFSYIKDAGGVKRDNAIIFGYNLTAIPKSLSSGQKIDVNFTVEPKRLDGRIQLVGKTNLPDGTD